MSVTVGAVVSGGVGTVTLTVDTELLPAASKAVAVMCGSRPWPSRVPGRRVGGGRVGGDSTPSDPELDARDADVVRGGGGKTTVEPVTVAPGPGR